MTNHTKIPQQLVTFSIDGEQFTTSDHRQPARELLRLAGVDPSDYDLAELVGERPTPKRYEDDEEVTIHRRSRFITLRVGPAPVE